MNPADMEGMVPAAPAIPSILDRLKSEPNAQGPRSSAPLQASVEREAKERASRRWSGRVSEFPVRNTYLTVSHSKLFCSACQEELSLKKDDVQCM